MKYWDLHIFSLRPEKRSLDPGTRGKRVGGTNTERSSATGILDSEAKVAFPLVLGFLLAFPVSSGNFYASLRLVLTPSQGTQESYVHSKLGRPTGPSIESRFGSRSK